MSHPYSEQANAITSSAFGRIDEAVRAKLDDIFTACAFGILYRGELVLDGAWGWIDPETKQYPMTTDKRFDLASVSKLFTHTAFLSLVSEGKIRLEDKLVDVIPEFGEISPCRIEGIQDPHSKERLPTPDEYVGKTVNPADVTFWHLMTHTSGLAPWRDVYNMAGASPPPPTEPDPISQAERWSRGLEAICQYPFGSEVDNVVHYSDLGLMLLGEATARLYGTAGRLDKVVQARVSEPLGLSTVTYNPVRSGLSLYDTVPTEPDPTWRKRRAWGEVHDENSCGLGGITGHAGLFGTAKDIATFGQAWLSRDERLQIDPSLMDKATHYQARGSHQVGLGWMLKAGSDSSAGDLYSAKSYGHTGFTGTSLWIDPERELVVALLTNRNYMGREKVGIHSFRRQMHDLIVQEVAQS